MGNFLATRMQIRGEQRTPIRILSVLPLSKRDVEKLIEALHKKIQTMED